MVIFLLKAVEHPLNKLVPLLLNARQPGTVFNRLDARQSVISTEFPPKGSFKLLRNIRCWFRIDTRNILEVWVVNKVVPNEFYCTVMNWFKTRSEKNRYDKIWIQRLFLFEQTQHRILPFLTVRSWCMEVFCCVYKLLLLCDTMKIVCTRHAAQWFDERAQMDW